MTKKQSKNSICQPIMLKVKKECMRNRIIVCTYVFTCIEYKDKLGDYICF